MRLFEKVSYAPADTKLPTRKTKASAGYDFYMPYTVIVPAHGFSEIIPTGIKAFFPDNEVLMLYIRSSVGIKKHVVLANGTGIIDSDYYGNPENEGNIGICLHNVGDEDVTFEKGERIMQGIFLPYGITADDVTTGERKGATGSTGKF